MKNRIRNILSVIALMSIFINLQEGLFNNQWVDFKLSIQLLIIAALFFIVQELIIKCRIENQYIEIIVEFAIVLIIVTIAGLVFKWTTLDTLFYNAWIVFVVYVIAFILRMTSTMKTVREVNALIKETEDYD